MSWQISMIGKPENVIAALKANSEKLEGQSKIEFDSALPHLVGIVGEVFDKRPENKQTVVHLRASGSGYSVNGETINRSISVAFDPTYGEFV